MSRYLVVFATLVAFLSFGCDKNKDSDPSDKLAGNLRMANPSERAADFDQLIQLFKTFYGPYQYKEKNLGINIEQIGNDLKAQAQNAKTDEEFMGYVMQFGAAMQDGHVQFQLENSSSNIRAYTIPIMIQAVEDKAMVMDIDENLSKLVGIAKNHVIVSVDGKTPFEWLKLVQKYRRTARELSDRAFLMNGVFARRSYMTDILPTSPMAEVKFLDGNDLEQTVMVPWSKTKFAPTLDKVAPASRLNMTVGYAEEFNSHIEGHVGQMGADDPFFLNDQTQSKFGFIKAYPSDAARKKFGLKDEEKPPIYGALYKFNGKTLLLVRNSGYAPDDFKYSVYMKAYMALLSEYEAMADVLVLDQTHNGGGSYCADFYDIFAKNGDRQSVEAVRADRKWVNDLMINWSGDNSPDANPFDVRLTQAWGRLVEKAYDNGDFLSAPIPLFNASNFSTPRAYRWEKPMLVLIDELAGSCADMFPMLMKTNNRAKLFGQNTMGLGGNVEKVGQLNNSRISIAMTRGLFFPYHPDGKVPEFEIVENNGVAPDIEYAHTVKDIKAGYVDYVKTFSDKALEQIP